MSAAFETARDFAAHGFAVLPANGKQPLTPHGVKDATTDERTLLHWDERWPDANWAVACGERVAVIDIDSKAGADPAEVIDAHSLTGPVVWTGEATAGPLEGTRGAHVYCANGVPNGDAPVPGVEIKAAGYYVLLPGSRHASGVAYEWGNGIRPWTVSLEPVPEALRPTAKTGPAPPVGDVIGELRNVTLASVAGTMRRRGMSERSIVAALLVENADRCQPPLPEEDVRTIARSIGRYEPAEQPTTRGSLMDRVTDLAALVAQPPVPVPWVVEGVAARGKLTVIPGSADVGKSWFGIACGEGVGTGRPVAGEIPCEPGRALYVDGEMGADEFAARVRGLGMTGTELTHLDGAGLDLSTRADREALGALIGAGGFTFVVLDSLRALAPSMRENESDSVGPILSALRNMARSTAAAVLLLHHRGDSDKWWRGSSAMKDQSDALLGMFPGEDGLIMRLRCKGGGRVRFAPAPEDRWFERNPFTGALSPSRARPLPSEPASTTPRRDEVKDDVLDVLPAKSMREVARTLGFRETDRTLTAAWRELREDGEIVQVTGVWQCSASLPSLRTEGDALHPDQGEIAPVCESCAHLLANINGRWACVNRDCAEAGL